jgi:PAS domain S-box-containing protein
MYEMRRYPDWPVKHEFPESTDKTAMKKRARSASSLCSDDRMGSNSPLADDVDKWLCNRAIATDRLSLVACNTRDSVIIKDAEDRIEWVNDSFTRYYGYTLEECRGQVHHALIADGESVPGAMPATFDTDNLHNPPGRRRAEVIRSGKDGQMLWLTLECRPITDEDGAVTGYIEIEKDITERKQAESELLEAKRAAEAATQTKSDFLATVCHEIRNPLNVMIGTMDLALQTPLTNEQREYLSLMKTSSGSLMRVFNDLLDIARIEAGCLQVENIPFSLRDCVGEALKMFVFEAQRKGLALTYDIAPNLPDALLGDPMRLRQIVINLVSNAIKFTERGEIRMCIEGESIQQGEVVCRFSVSDSGIGIAKDKLDAIFKPFQQADNSTARRYGGSGLGLSIAARLVELMNGSIWLDSSPGKGSTFFFSARFSRQPGAQHDASAADSANAMNTENAGRLTPAGLLANLALRSEAINEPVLRPGGQTGLHITGKPKLNLTVLLVDDSPISRRFSQLLLEDMGCRVLLADNGELALGILNRALPDLVLMDVHMPTMDGIETTMKIRSRQIPGQPRIPVVALTAYVTERDREFCLRAGIDACLIKPIDSTQLLEVIEQLGLAESERETRQGPASKGRVLDVGVLLSRVNGDKDLLDEIGTLFQRSCGTLMGKARSAMVNRDKAEFADVMHTLLGLFGSLAAVSAQEIVESLQGLCVETEAERVEVHFAQLTSEVDSVSAALTDLGIRMQTPPPLHRPWNDHAERQKRTASPSAAMPPVTVKPWHVWAQKTGSWIRVHVERSGPHAARKSLGLRRSS